MCHFLTCPLSRGVRLLFQPGFAWCSKKTRGAPEQFSGTGGCNGQDCTQLPRHNIQVKSEFYLKQSGIYSTHVVHTYYTCTKKGMNLTLSDLPYLCIYTVCIYIYSICIYIYSMYIYYIYMILKFNIYDTNLLNVVLHKPNSRPVFLFLSLYLMSK